MLKSKSLKFRLALLVLAALVGLVVLGTFQALDLRTQMLEDRKATLISAIEIAVSAVKNLQAAESKGEMSRYDELKKLLWIKAESPKNSILSLSGGNQQKVFLARWLNTKADVLLLDNPTQGVDVGAKAEIYRLILEFASRGMTVIINTLEIPEIKKVSDRCVVFFEGRVAKIFQHDEINEHDVMLYSTNAINTRRGANHVG